LTTYAFEAKDGEPLDIEYETGTAPLIGDWVWAKGRDGKRKRFRRVFAGSQRPLVPNYEFASYQPELFDPRAKYHSADGRPAFKTKQDVLEYIAKTKGSKQPFEAG